MTMYKVCDQNLQIVSEWAALAAAKAIACLRAREYGQVYFVADCDGNILAGY